MQYKDRNEVLRALRVCHVTLKEHESAIYAVYSILVCPKVSWLGNSVRAKFPKKYTKELLVKLSFIIFAVLKVSTAWIDSILFYRSGLNLKGGKI